jgi:hypothetical protein
VKGYDRCLIYLAVLVDFTALLATTFLATAFLATASLATAFSTAAFLATGFLAAGFAALLALNNYLHLLFPDNTLTFLTITTQSDRHNSSIGSGTECNSHGLLVLTHSEDACAWNGKHSDVLTSKVSWPEQERSISTFADRLPLAIALAHHFGHCTIRHLVELWRRCGEVIMAVLLRTTRIFSRPPSSPTSL